MKRIIIKVCLVCLVVLSGNLKSQGTFVNRDFEEDTGNPLFNPILNPLGVEWSKSILASGGTGIITTGYTSVSGQGQNILLTKYDPDGNLIFSVNYNVSGSFNDYGTGVYEAANGDILVCGTTDNGGSTDYDVVVLRYSSTGSLLNTSIQDGSANKNDVAISITEDGSGNIIVAANTEGASGYYDYWALMFDNALNLQHDATYDYAGLNDFAIGVEFSTLGNVCLIGASASGTNACDYAMATFSGANLSYISDTRNNIPGTALDQAHAFAKDGSGNMYVTGQAWNGSDFDIKTIKIASNLTIAWTSTLDAYGMNDVANSIAIDPNTNDIIVGGYSTRSNNKKELICVRYNSSSGSSINSYRYLSEDPSGDAYIKKLTTNSIGDVYFVGGELGVTGNKQTIVGKIKATGKASWARKVVDATQDILASDIEVSSNEIYVISVKDSTLDRYITTGFSELELDTSSAFYGPTKFKRDELIVRFLPSALDSDRIDNKTGPITDFEDLSYYMKPMAYSTVTNALETVCRDCEIKAVKIFPGHLTSYTSTITRLGEIIDMPDFWTALLLVFPQNTNVHQMANVFNSLPTVAAYAHPNWLVQLFSVPDDSLYQNQQLSLHSNTVFPGCDINMEEAWDIVKDGGKSHVRCGVFDVGLDWENVDFGYDGVNPATSKIPGGWDFTLPMGPLKSLSHGGASGNLHATAVSGIIGAQRNNHRGIAGIAGGNDSTGSKGISVYGCTIFDSNGGAMYGPTYYPYTYISNALFWTTQAPLQSTVGAPQQVNSYTFKLHIENLSWGLYVSPYDTGAYANWVESTNLFHEAMHKINRMKVTAVAARGNDSLNKINYPACTDDDWAITVTGTGVNGQFAHSTNAFAGPINSEFTSNYGGPVDIAAPASGSIITSLSTPNLNNLGSVYNSFGGTSAAAPHVTGAVGLLMSYLNDTVAAYKNLAPEDCEQILQLSATDTDSAGYDQLTGYGRLNVGKALKLVHKSYTKLLHFGTLTPWSFNTSVSLYSPSDTVWLTERFQHPVTNTWFQKGKYFVRTYEVTSVVNHYVDPQDTIVAYWPRPSSSVTWPLFTNGKILPREKTNIISLNHNYATLKGYIYKVQDSLGNPKGWWPVDSAFVGHTNYGSWAEYSVLTRNLGNPVGISEKIEATKNVKIFPNPTGGRHTIQINSQKVSTLEIDLYDVMGRKISVVYTGKTQFGKMELTYDVSNLPNSMYIYLIKIDGLPESLRFIKQ